MDLSIVIPAYEESTKIARDVQEAARFLQENNFTGEIIVVDDGSQDDTSVVAKTAGEESKIPLKVLRYERHHGKGFAIRMGIKETGGQFVMFADSGLCVPYDNTLLGLQMLKDRVCEIAHGSRKLKDSMVHRAQPLTRRIITKIMRWSLIVWLKIPSELSDTQCGFKIYRGEVARKLYGQCMSRGFLFDAEIIVRAINQGYRIKEFPIQWTSDPDSRLFPFRNLWHTLIELIALKKFLTKL